MAQYRHPLAENTSTEAEGRAGEETEGAAVMAMVVCGGRDDPPRSSSTPRRLPGAQAGGAVCGGCSAAAREAPGAAPQP